MKIASAALVLACLLFAPFKAHSAGVGEAAPAFSLTDIRGNTVALDNFKGKVVFLDFWATWCAPCKEEIPELEALYQKYKGEGLEVIGVSVDKSESNVAEFLKKRPATFTVLTNTKGDVAENYGLPGMPTGFIIGRDGIIRYRHAGYSKAFLPVYEKEITELLKK